LSRMNKLLVLSASYGDGHQKAANAVRESMGQLSPDTDVEIIDYMKVVHPVLDSVAKYCYLKSVQFAPALYGWFYKGTSQIQPSSLLQRQLNSLGIDDLADILNDYRPDCVLATFPTPAGVVSYLKQQGRTDVPLATVITDHAVHSQWIHPLTDVYFVGSNHVRKGLIARGISGDTIQVTGIPIRPEFLQPLDRQSLQRKHGLNPLLPTVLMMGGAYGVMGDIQQICEELFQYPRPLQVIVVTGRNERLKSHIEVLVQDAIHPVFVHGFVSEIHELMAISDVMLTKAGGLTVSEALAIPLPMLLYRPIPGQEVQNTKYLTHMGAATYARNRKEVIAELQDLLFDNPERRFAMARRAQDVCKLHAGDEIATGLLQLSEQSLMLKRYAMQQG